MTLFAREEQDVVHNARDLSEKSHIPLPMVSKILKLLSKEDLLCSQRGAKGGYQLERSPHAISLADVILALEGPIALTECAVESDTDCDIQNFCGASTNWQRINQALRETLEGISLLEMAKSTVACQCEDLESVSLSDSRASINL